MKRIFTQSILLVLVMAFWSCSDDIKIPDNLFSKPQSITGLRKVQIKDNLRFGETAIKGIVISDPASRNIEDGIVIVQQEGKEVAIVLELDGSTEQYSLGAEVELNMENAKLSFIDGELTVTNLPASQVKITGKRLAIAPKITNLPTILANAEYWGPILIKLEKVDISGGNSGMLSGELTLDDGIGTVFSTIHPDADFSNNELPDFAEAYVGILRKNDSKVFINPRNIDDIQVGLLELLEDFEDATSSSYDIKTLSFRSGNWLIDGGITAATASDLKNGKQSIRLQGTVGNAKRNGIIEMEFDLKAVKTLRISHGIYPAAAETSNVNPTTLDIEVSKDGGKTYTLVKQVEVDIDRNSPLKTDIINVNAGFSENVRFRIVNSSTPFANNNRPRINVDDILFEF